MLRPHARWLALLGLVACTDAAGPRTPVFSATFIATGPNHSCGLIRSGAAYCWGSNSYGQLGTGDSAARTGATPVATSVRFVGLSLGLRHSCGWTVGGAAYCWGDNAFGELGDSTATAHPTPTPVTGGLTFTVLASHSQVTCGLLTDGQPRCWGSSAPIFGDSLVALSRVPLFLAPSPAFDTLVVGYTHVCGLTAAGAAYCWGYALGTGTDSTLPTTSIVSVPTPVLGNAQYRALAAGGDDTCGILLLGGTQCWGGNFLGALGDSTTFDRKVPVAVLSPLMFVEIALGEETANGIVASGEAYYWGRVLLGLPELAPTLVPGGLHFKQLTTQKWTACGRTTSDEVYCWTAGNASGDPPAPTPVLPDTAG